MCGASFVRVEGFVFAHVADEGVHESDAGDLLRYRKSIGAENVRIFDQRRYDDDSEEGCKPECRDQDRDPELSLVHGPIPATSVETTLREGLWRRE